MIDTIKAAPIWSHAMIRNYRDQFKARYGRETTLTDVAIFTITKTVFDDDSSKAQDDARVDVMFEQEEA